MRIERIAWLLLCALVFSIPWEKSIWVPGIGTITRLIGLLALPAGVAAAVSRRSIRFPHLALLAAAVFVLWASLTYFWSVSPADTVARMQTFTQLLAMLWLVWDLCRTGARQTALTQAYVAGAAVAALLTLLRYAQGLETYWRRYAAVGFEPNDMGLTLALALPLAMYLTLRERRPLRWVYSAAAVLVFTALLLTASRTAFVAGIVAFSFAVWTWRESDAAQRIANAVLFGWLVLGALYLAPPASRQRLATLPAEATQGTFHNRTYIWKAGVKVVLSHPVRGVGAGAFPEAARPWLRIRGLAGRYVAHNTYLSVLAEEGLIGFGVCALLLGTLIAYVWMMPPAERALWFVTLAVWAVGAMTMSWEHRKPVWLFFGLIMTEWAKSFRRGMDGSEDSHS